jgi:hypothetical protein
MRRALIFATAGVIAAAPALGIVGSQAMASSGPAHVAVHATQASHAPATRDHDKGDDHGQDGRDHAKGDRDHHGDRDARDHDNGDDHGHGHDGGGDHNRGHDGDG